ncbi:MAG: hypothetical protein JJ895_11475 [Balneolaceae bacterium]|nr:hypothetical protein [Balneolaceae bacterium]
MRKYILALSLVILLCDLVYSQQLIEEIRYDSLEGYYVLTYKYPDSDSSFTGTIMPRNNVIPTIKAMVSENESGNFHYRYELTNELESLQLLRRFYIISSLLVSNITTPSSEWLGIYSQNRGYIFWSKIKGVPGLTPGNSLTNYSFESDYPPSISTSISENTFWVSFPYELEGPFGKLDSIVDSLSSVGVEKLTLGPWLPDSTISLDSFSDTLETFRFRSCTELDWATDAKVCGKLENDLSEVKANLQAGDSLSAANALSNFIELVEQEKDESLTSEGYALLYFNAEYLAERLPEPVDEPEGSGITCDCANPVTQTSGQIRFSGGETQCLSGEFSGSVFFQQAGRLEVCGNATFQNISGNNTGTVAVSETGVVSIQNWNNNNSADSLINWGSMEFRNQVNVNRGSVQLSVSGVKYLSSK